MLHLSSAPLNNFVKNARVSKKKKKKKKKVSKILGRSEKGKQTSFFFLA